jgi:hypothetical protein
MVAVVAAGVLAVPVMTGSAYATGSSSAKPGSRPHSPTSGSHKSRADKRAEYGARVAAYLKTGNGVPEEFGFTPVSGEDELLRSFRTRGNGVFTVLATRVKEGKTEAAEFLTPALGGDGTLTYVTTNGGRALTGAELRAAGLTHLFYLAFHDGINSQVTTPRTFQGDAKEIYDHLNNTDAPGVSSKDVVRVNGVVLTYSPNQAKMFKYLHENPGQLNGTIQTALTMTKEQVQSALDGLMVKKLVTRAGDPGMYRYSVVDSLPSFDTASSSAAPTPATLQGHAKKIYGYLNSKDTPGAKSKHAVRVNGVVLTYSPNQAKMFKYLHENPGQLNGTIQTALTMTKEQVQHTLEALMVKKLVTRTGDPGMYQYSVVKSLPSVED